jgi:hypothetical protein
MSENIAKIYKIAEVKKQIEELFDNAKKDILQNYIEKVFNSGALNDDLMVPHSFVLAKIIVTAYFNKQPFRPLDDSNRKALKNLEYFI